MKPQSLTLRPIRLSSITLSVGPMSIALRSKANQAASLSSD